MTDRCDEEVQLMTDFMELACYELVPEKIVIDQVLALNTFLHDHYPEFSYQSWGSDGKAALPKWSAVLESGYVEIDTLCLWEMAALHPYVCHSITWLNQDQDLVTFTIHDDHDWELAFHHLMKTVLAA